MKKLLASAVILITGFMTNGSENLVFAQQVIQLFGATPTFPTGPFTSPDDAIPFSGNSFILSFEPGDFAVISSTPDGTGPIVIDNFMTINGVNVCPPDGPERGVSCFGPIIQPDEPIGVPIETVLTPIPPFDVTAFIPVGTAPIVFELLDFGRIAGNTKLFLVITDRHLPLIFIPGTSASELANAEGIVFWPYRSLLAEQLGRLTLDPSKRQSSIFPFDAIRTAIVHVPSVLPISDRTIPIYKPLLDRLIDLPFGLGYTEYRSSGTRQRLTTAGCDVSQKSFNPTLFVFYYDWRKSNVERAIALKDYVGCIQQFYPNSKVDILAHSMGGLIARRYILDNPGTHNVARLVTIGSPWLGAPKSNYIMETGDFISLTALEQFVIWGGDALPGVYKALVEFFPSSHQLLPSRWFFEFASPFREDGWDINTNGNAFEEYSYEQFINLLNRRFRSAPGTTGRDFHNNPGQDDWRTDNSGVQYLHIVGIKKRADTIGKVIARRKTACIRNACLSALFLDLQMTSGDGTVPLVSAERVDRAFLPPRINLNAPKATVRAFFNLPKIGDEEGSEHTTLTKDRTVQNTILSFLDRGAIAVPARRGELVPQVDQGSLPALQPAFYLRITGAVINVTDAFGNSTDQLSAVPGVTGYITGEDSRLLVIDPDREYTVTFLTGTDPIALEITKGTDVSTTMAIRYQDLILPVGVEAMLKFNPDAPNGVERLKVDANGDGTFDTQVAPTVEMEGAAAEDVVPPTIRMTARAVRPNATLVTLIAEDVGSGVKDIFFSLNGIEYHQYTGTLRLNPKDTPVIDAFADDNVGNRSSTVTFQIGPHL